MKNNLFLILVILSGFVSQLPARQISLGGKWDIVLDNCPDRFTLDWFDSHCKETIDLPATTDIARLGTPNSLKAELQKPQLLHLTRKYSYIGPAWYSREIIIPENWNDKQIYLNLERTIWKTNVWIDETKVSESCNSLSTPHVYNLTEYLKPGKYRLTVCVDNSKIFDDLSYQNLAHAYTDHTQTIWNGIIGNISLEGRDALHISRVEVIPDLKRNQVSVKTFVNNLSDKKIKSELVYKINGFSPLKKKELIEKGETVVEMIYPLGDKVELWSEFNPIVYNLSVNLKSGKYNDEYNTDFGMREFTAKGNILMNNGKPIFLRGTLECSIFPLTGHPPMTKDEWKIILNKARSWGLNHLRFHSWCPPKAAFEAADETGFYFQVELPLWSLKIENDSEMTRYLYDEARRIINEYGNHPSFCMFSLGNELQGDMSVLADLTDKLKKQDKRRLYTTTSFSFEKGYGTWSQPEDDFFITQWTKKGWVRGQGVFNSEVPSFNKDYYSSVDSMQVPLITHEIGQYAVYPSMKEISKYTGVLKPLNFKAIKEDLRRKGLLQYADDYLQASGKLAAILYKEEIERALKTSGISGFQLLDLHDFPGQGTALVGLLDAFWDSKGIISDNEFRQFCSPVVPLLRFEKAVYKSDETFIATIEVSNYSGKELNGKSIRCNIKDENGKVVYTNVIDNVSLGLGHNLTDGKIKFPLISISNASKLTIEIKIEDSLYENKWDIWVYPAKLVAEYGAVKYTRDFREAYSLLQKGEVVLYNPDWKSLKGIEGKFVPVFWSPVHFPNQAGTMGVLCDSDHEALKYFPTENHSNWQWWDLNINSTTLITDSLQGGKSIVSMVDNFINNRRLSSVYEGKVGNGKLIISSIDLNSDLEKRPVAGQLLFSLLRYMNSEYFNPSIIENFEVFESFLLEKENSKKESATDIY